MEAFFEKIKRILDFEKMQLDERKKRGELFNIFEVLGITSNEVRTHSPFIAELLNPYGSHGMGATPLSLFVQLINSRVQNFDFDVNNATVSVEKSIGKIDESYKEGGRLDILIQSNGKAILIENKVYADDQFQQLTRYYAYAKHSFGEGNFLLLYLALEEREAKDCSTQSDQKSLIVYEDYLPISYKNEIQQWIRLCLAAAYDKPLIRETLNQYLSLILNMTTNMASNNKEVIKLMVENPEIVTKILYVQDEYKQHIISNVLIESFNRFAIENGLEMNVEPGFGAGKKYSRLSIRKKEWRNAEIVIIPENKQSNYWIGIMHRDPNSLLKTEQYSLSMLTDGTNERYPFGSKWLPGVYRWLYDAKTIEDIISGEFIKIVGNLIKDIINEVESIPRFAEL
jgi:hypothetical protein